MLRFKNVVPLIDDAPRTQRRLLNVEVKYVVATPTEATGLLRWRIRFIKAWRVLIGDADAFRYSKEI